MEEALDLSFDRLLMMMMMIYKQDSLWDDRYYPEVLRRKEMEAKKVDPNDILQSFCLLPNADTLYRNIDQGQNCVQPKVKV